MIYEIKKEQKNNIKEEKLILSYEIDNKGDFTLIAEIEGGRQNRIFTLTSYGFGYLYSYIQDDIGLQLDNKGKLIIKEII